jgi:hypothetical protein
MIEYVADTSTHPDSPRTLVAELLEAVKRSLGKGTNSLPVSIPKIIPPRHD